MESNSTEVPALQPPPGQVSNIVDPWSVHDVADVFIALAMAVTTLTMVIRVFTRFYLLSSCKADDVLMLIAWVAFIPFSVVLLISITYGTGTHQWDLTVAQWSEASFYGLLVTILYPITLGVAKLSICLQVLRIFVVYRGRDFWLVWTFIGLQALWFAQWFVIVMVRCSSIKRGRDIPVLEYCLGRNQTYMIGLSIFNMVSDILMLSFPLYCISKLQLQRQKRLSALAVFTVGFMAIIASVLRIVYSVQNRLTEDQSFGLLQLGLCSYAEVAAGIIAGNIISLPKLYSATRTRLSSIASNLLAQRSSKRTTSDTDSERSSDSESRQSVEKVEIRPKQEAHLKP